MQEMVNHSLCRRAWTEQARIQGIGGSISWSYAKIFDNKEPGKGSTGVTNDSRLIQTVEWNQSNPQARLALRDRDQYLFKEHPLTQPERTDTHNLPHNSPHNSPHYSLHTLVSNE